MIIGYLLFWLEVCSVVILLGLGARYIYRTRQQATINASAQVMYDMRLDGQPLNVQTSPLALS